MLDTIQKKLDEIERQEQVRILHCVESGSRAWGFASPDSDYDVRFVYLRKREDYLRLEGIRDVIEWQLDDVLDINGWDIQKYLRLLYKSNPTVLEWDRSPIVYRTTPEWEQISAVTEQYFRQDHLLHHYLSMAKSNERAYLREEQVKLKKYFYVIRPLLACRWILDQGTPPPIEFAKLTEAELPAELNAPMEELLEQKRMTPETGKRPHIAVFDQFIAEQFETLEAAAGSLHGRPEHSWEALDRIFLRLTSQQDT